MTTPSWFSPYVIGVVLALTAFPIQGAASTLAQCKQKSQKLKKKCEDVVKQTKTDNDAAVAKRQGEIGGAGNHRSAEILSMESLAAYEREMKGMKECEEQEKQCEKACDQSKAPANEKLQVKKEFESCKQDIDKKKQALKGAGGQNQDANKGAQKTGDASGADKKQEGGGEGDKKKEGGGGGAPPPPPPPPPSPPTEPKTADNQTPPTRLPGDASGGSTGTFANNECNGSSFGAVNPNCIPGAGQPTTGTAVASVEDPLKKKCLSGDNSPECQNYRASTAGLATASTGSGGGGGGGGGVGGGSSTQARLDPNIPIPDVQGNREGLSGLNVDAAGGYSGSSGGAGGSSSSSLEDSLFGNRNSGSGSGAGAGRGFATASAVASDVASNPGPSVISIVSTTIRNWCTSKAVPNCGPRPGK